MEKYNKIKKIIESYGCELLSPTYENNVQKIKIKCRCGEIFETTFGIFNAEKRRKCSYCSGRKLRPSYVKEVIEKSGCKLLSEFENVNKKIKIACSCGEIFETTFGNFRNKHKNKCNSCSLGRSSKSGLTYDEVLEYVESKGVKLLSTNFNYKEKMKLLCPCGNVYYAHFNKFKSSNKIRCNVCTRRMSKIEILTKQYLDDNNIKYEQEFMFSDLKVRSNVYLKFDFAIYKDDNLLFLLELDGEQHFKPIDKFGGEEEFVKRLKNDKMKDNYCKKNNIKLIRIPYYKFNKIHQELENILI